MANITVLRLHAVILEDDAIVLTFVIALKKRARCIEDILMVRLVGKLL